MQILFEQSQGTVKINGKNKNIINGTIDIIVDEQWQIMQFESKDAHLKIKNILLDQRPIDYLLYIMYDQNHKCTFGDLFPNTICSMPIHPNYAIFRSTVCQQLTNGWYGKQIYDHFEFSLDSAVEFLTEQPKHIKDFFAIDTGAHWIKKYHKDSSWFYNEPHDVNQIKKQIDPELFEIEPAGGDTNSGWTMRNLIDPSVEKLEQLGLTFFVDLAKKHRFTRIASVSCNTLDSGGHIGIHIDGNLDKTPRKKIYLNLDPSDHVYFKFATTGLVPMNTERSMWFNTDQHVHAVVNDSTTARQIISISGDAEWP